ncbi:MAG: MFS transporter [Microcoleaceae cyanobacterium]
MNVFLTLDPKPRRSLYVLFIVGLCFWSSITSLLPTIPLYLEFMGATKPQIGLVMGAFALGLLPSRFGLGPLADVKGRKLLLYIGTFVAATAPIGYLLANSIASMALIRGFHGISIAAFTIGYSAIVADIAPIDRRGTVIGYMSLVNSIGMAIGPALGGFLEASTGYNTLFIISAILGTLGFLGIYQVWEPSRPQPVSQVLTHRQRWQGIVKYFRLWGQPSLRTPALVMLMVGLIFGTLVTFLPLYIKASGIDLNAGLFYSAAAIASFCVRAVVGRASDRLGRGVFISGGLSFYLLSMLMLWVANSSVTLILAAVLEGMAAGIVIPMMVTLITDRCSPQERGRYFSLCIGGFDVGIALAGPMFGLIAETVGYRNLFLMDAGLAAIALAVFFTQSNPNLTLSLQFALGKAKDAHTYKAEHLS